MAITVRKISKAPVTVVLALLLFSSTRSSAQSCDSDGVSVEFSRTRGGALSLQDVRTKELTGNNWQDQSVRLASAPELTARVSNAVLIARGLDESDYPLDEFVGVRFDRKLPNIWEVNFPRNLYEFQNKSDLRVEVILTVSAGKAVHVTEGGTSSVALDVQEGMIHEIWWGGSNSLKTVRGNLEFTFSDIQKLARAGIHRADLNVCVNIRGHL